MRQSGLDGGRPRKHHRVGLLHRLRALRPRLVIRIRRTDGYIDRMIRLESEELQRLVLAQPATQLVGCRGRHDIGAPIHDHGLVALAHAVGLVPCPDREGDGDRGVEVVAHGPGIHVG